MGPRGSPSRCSGPNRPQNSWRTQGGSGRQHHVLMEIQLSKVSWGLSIESHLDGGQARHAIPGTQPALHHGHLAPSPRSGTMSLSVCRVQPCHSPGAVLDFGGSSEHGRKKPRFPGIMCGSGGSYGSVDLYGVAGDKCLGKASQGGARHREEPRVFLRGCCWHRDPREGAG